MARAPEDSPPKPGAPRAEPTAKSPRKAGRPTSAKPRPSKAKTAPKAAKADAPDAAASTAKRGPKPAPAAETTAPETDGAASPSGADQAQLDIGFVEQVRTITHNFSTDTLFQCAPPHVSPLMHARTAISRAVVVYPCTRV